MADRDQGGIGKRDVDRLAREIRRSGNRRDLPLDDLLDDFFEDLFSSRVFHALVVVVALLWAADTWLGWTTLPTVWSWVQAAWDWVVSRVQAYR